MTHRTEAAKRLMLRGSFRASVPLDINFFLLKLFCLKWIFKFWRQAVFGREEPLGGRTGPRKALERALEPAVSVQEKPFPKL